MNNKITGKSKERKIVVGLSGGMDSAITAFLLKKQGYKCIGVTLVNIDDLMLNRFPTMKQFPAARVEPLDRIRALCKRLEIPFYAVDGKPDYNDRVFENFVAAKILGDQFTLSVPAHSFVLETLAEKAQKLGADAIATGHYAKVHFHQGKKKYYVYGANDLDWDQSHLLSRVGQDVLEKLVLPLGDTRREEVVNLLAKFSFPCVAREKIDESVFYHASDLISFVKERVDTYFKKEGPLFNKATEVTYGDHEGVCHYTIGQGNIMVPVSNTPLDKSLRVVFIYPAAKAIYLGTESDLVTNGCILNNFKVVSGVDFSKPLKVQIKFNHLDKRENATLFFKNNRFAELVFENQVSLLVRRQFITVYSGEGKNAQVLASGQVFRLGQFLNIHRAEAMLARQQDEHGQLIPIVGEEFGF